MGVPDYALGTRLPIASEAIKHIVTSPLKAARYFPTQFAGNDNCGANLRLFGSARSAHVRPYSFLDDA